MANLSFEEIAKILSESGIEESKEFPETVNPSINTKTMNYKKIAECVGQTLIIKGVFFTKSKFGGLNVAVVTDDFIVNMPARATAAFQKMVETEEGREAVMNGLIKITNIKKGFSKKYNTETTYYDIVPVNK